MIKYAVKTISTATPENPSFAGRTITAIYGKDQTQLACDGDPWSNRDLNRYMLMEYGYQSESAAKRSYIYKNPENTRYWKSTVEIVAYEIHDIFTDPKEIPNAK